MAAKLNARRATVCGMGSVGFLTLLALGCESDRSVGLTDTKSPENPVIASLVAGEAAIALGPDGQFQFSAPTPLSVSRQEITESRARELAQAFVPSHARGLRKMLEGDHGGPIETDALRVCGRVFYAHSNFEPLAPEVPSVYHRIFGPWWLVTLCGSANRPQVSVAVSAYATELQINNGRLQYPKSAGEEIHVLGIPRTLPNGLPGSPERAVEQGAKRAGSKIAGVPQLLAPPPGFYPQTGRWRLPLESAVTLRVSEATSVRSVGNVTEIFVGTRFFANPEQIQIADTNQPASLPLLYRPDPPPGATRQTVEGIQERSSVLVRRAGFPLKFLATEEN